jgi:hypothetical protein
VPVYAEPEEPDRLNQGELRAEVPFIGQDSRDLTKVIRMLGVITAHSCDCDKFFTLRERGALEDDHEATWPIMVAPVHPPELLIGGQAGDAKAGRMPRYFPLAAENSMPELVVDLAREQAVPALTLLDCPRQGCFSAETLRKMYVALWRLRTRLKPEDVFREDIRP